MSAIREVRLYGILGERFGRVHRLAVSSPAEAIRALMANHSDFERSMINDAPGYRVWSGTTRVGQPEDVTLPSGQRDVIRIAPVVVGAGKNVWGTILLGAALIAVSVMTGGFGTPLVAAWGAGAGMFASALVGTIGLGLVLGGVAQLLSKQPNLNPGSNENSQSPSYVFNGAVNTSAQGHPVPVGYGRMIVGSAVISVGISTEEIPV